MKEKHAYSRVMKNVDISSYKHRSSSLKNLVEHLNNVGNSYITCAVYTSTGGVVLFSSGQYESNFGMNRYSHFSYFKNGVNYYFYLDSFIRSHREIKHLSSIFVTRINKLTSKPQQLTAESRR